MRGRSSIRLQRETTKEEAMEMDKLGSGSGKANEEEPPHLSGAYIRSLVKQLTSSRTKDPSSPPAAAHVSSSTSSQSGSAHQETRQPQPPPQHKKQVRRRLHTSRPYQERLLNMAEARREIVTALKYHRAAMKQANEQQQQLQLQQEEGKEQQPLQDHQFPCFEQETKVKSRRNPRTYPSSSGIGIGNNYHYVDNFSSSHPLPPPPPPCSFPWTNSPILPPQQAVVGGETLNFPLPNQPLGLNLNIQEFNNIDATTLLYHNNNNSPSSLNIYHLPSPSSPPSSSTSHSLSINNNAAEEEANLLLQQQQQRSRGVAHVPLPVAPPPPPPPPPPPSCSSSISDGFHHVMDDEEMAEMRSIGEQHQMEWNDTMNLVTSAWWFKFMKTVELKAVHVDDDDHDNGSAGACHNHHPFDEIPPWLNPANDATLQQHIDDYNCPQNYYSHDPTLPCMDLGEIEGIDGEWWA